jgi:hypothetical protein
MVPKKVMTKTMPAAAARHQDDHPDRQQGGGSPFAAEPEGLKGGPAKGGHRDHVPVDQRAFQQRIAGGAAAHRQIYRQPMEQVEHQQDDGGEIGQQEPADAALVEQREFRLDRSRGQ